MITLLLLSCVNIRKTQELKSEWASFFLQYMVSLKMKLLCHSSIWVSSQQSKPTLCLDTNLGCITKQQNLLKIGLKVDSKYPRSPQAGSQHFGISFAFDKMVRFFIPRQL